MPRSVFRVFKSIQLGNEDFRTGQDFCHTLQAQHFCLDSGVEEMLDQPDFRVAHKFAEVDLVIVKTRDLDSYQFNFGGRYFDICRRAFLYGLELCPAEVGPRLRLQYIEQPEGEPLLLAMMAIRGSYGHLCGFKLDNDRYRGPGIYSYDCSPDRVWYSNTLFVFARPRKKS